ncbi:hypothetical protein HGO21_16555 [Acinetobacter sp. CUI P1]|nr:hypothetical protein [Acinetobacter sp. CUI P1]
MTTMSNCIKTESSSEILGIGVQDSVQMICDFCREPADIVWKGLGQYCNRCMDHWKRNYKITNEEHSTRLTMNSWTNSPYEISKRLLEGGDGILAELEFGPMDSIDMKISWLGLDLHKLSIFAEFAEEPELYPEGTDIYALGYDEGPLFRLYMLNDFSTEEGLFNDKLFLKDQAIDAAEEWLRKEAGKIVYNKTAVRWVRNGDTVSKTPVLQSNEVEL